MNEATPPASGLDVILAQVRYLIFDFDGPLCALSDALASQQPANQIWQIIAQDDAPLPAEIESTADPLAILRYAASQSTELAVAADPRLTELETAAITAATGNPHASDCLNACRESGRSATVISAISEQAVRHYLTAHNLDGLVAMVVARPRFDPASPTTNIDPIAAALQSLSAIPLACALISASPATISQARAAGIHIIGEATTPDQADQLTTAGASAVIYSLSALTLRLRARCPSPVSEPGHCRVKPYRISRRRSVPPRFAPGVRPCRADPARCGGIPEYARCLNRSVSANGV